MGKFEGILLATDWDGTFYQGKLFDENIKALKYYVAEGGKFTVCSGRYSGFLASFKDIVPFNTYTICYNGAYIVDLNNNDILYKGFCDEHLFDIVDDIIEAKLEYTTISIYNDKDNEPVTYTIDDFFQKKEEIKKEKIYKILFRAETTDAGTRGAQAVNKMELYNYIAVRSWGLSLEILKRESRENTEIKLDSLIKLRDFAASKKHPSPSFHDLGESPMSTPSNREFIIECRCMGNIASATAKSKQEARALAAEKLLTKLMAAERPPKIEKRTSAAQKQEANNKPKNSLRISSKHNQSSKSDKSPSPKKRPYQHKKHL